MNEVIMQAAAVATLATLLSESTIATPVRGWLFKRMTWTLWYCPVCLGFWFALPSLWWGPVHYLAVVGISHIFMLVTLKVYEMLDELNGKPL